MTVRLHLYGRRECHLCAEMLDALGKYSAAIEVVEVDVDSDAGLVRRFGMNVPVLTDTDGNEICRHFFDATALGRHLGAA